MGPPSFPSTGAMLLLLAAIVAIGMVIGAAIVGLIWWLA